MHDIEPYHEWRDLYVASEDEKSPFFGVLYDEFKYSKKIYNYYIHPQWDNIGSPTLYIKILYADYDHSFCIIELMGEWNDCINNDVMYLKREIIDRLTSNKIYKFIMLCDLVLNYHADDDCYYEEWYEDIKEFDGWIYFLNIRHHVIREMNDIKLQNYISMGGEQNDIEWRGLQPKVLFNYLDNLID